MEVLARLNLTRLTKRKSIITAEIALIPCKQTTLSGKCLQHLVRLHADLFCPCQDDPDDITTAPMKCKQAYGCKIGLPAFSWAFSQSSHCLFFLSPLLEIHGMSLNLQYSLSVWTWSFPTFFGFWVVPFPRSTLKVSQCLISAENCLTDSRKGHMLPAQCDLSFGCLLFRLTGVCLGPCLQPFRVFFFFFSVSLSTKHFSISPAGVQYINI